MMQKSFIRKCALCQFNENETESALKHAIEDAINSTRFCLPCPSLSPSPTQEFIRNLLLVNENEIVTSTMLPLVVAIV